VKTLKLAIAAAAIVTIGAASSARAQMGANPAHFGIAAGASIPTGDLGNAVDVGYNITGMLELSPPTLPVGFRLEGAYNAFNFKGGGGSWKESAAIGNVLWSMPSTGIKPYLIGGIGYYRETGTVAGIGSGSANHFGFNAGAGVKLPLTGFETFIEARYHRISENSGNSASFVPITFGIVF
jgi:hypothetical protein